MNGIHDMGGMQDMGPIGIEKRRARVPRGRGKPRIFALFNAVGRHLASAAIAVGD